MSLCISTPFPVFFIPPSTSHKNISLVPFLSYLYFLSPRPIH
jgi:hypothetical protein